MTTASGAQAVQIVQSPRRGSRDIEHIGSAHDDTELELLKADSQAAFAGRSGRARLRLDQVGSPDRSGSALPITSTRMRHLTCAFTALGSDVASGGDEMYPALSLADVVPLGVDPQAPVWRQRIVAGSRIGSLRRVLLACGSHGTSVGEGGRGRGCPVGVRKPVPQRG